MNRIYHLVWKRTLAQWIAVTENVRNITGGAARLCFNIAPYAMFSFTALANSLCLVALVHGAPIGDQVTVRSGSVTESANTTVPQNSPTVPLSWQIINVAR
ncbi:MAG: ESPR-type extended signal peptide-containing protein [Burkholderiaceae bacterium]|jgi:hypothetical protein